MSELPFPPAPEETPPQPARKERGKRLLVLAAALALLAVFLWPRITLAVRALEARTRFGIATVRSPADADHDGLDDGADIMLAARAYVRTRPVYDPEYYAGGYPPEGHGVCADVLWHAFRSAGYDLKALVDADIAAHPGAYPLPDGMPDTNIDFRRVVNLIVFFRRRAETLTTDLSQTAEWQRGDIVFYEGHVGVVSDRRNGEGRPFIIHHTGHGAFEEDALGDKPVTGHFRWNNP